MVSGLELYQSRIFPSDSSELPSFPYCSIPLTVFEYQNLIRQRGLRHVIAPADPRTLAGLLHQGDLPMTQPELKASFYLLQTTIPPDCPVYIGRVPADRGKVEFVLSDMNHPMFLPLYPIRKRRNVYSTLTNSAEAQRVFGKGLKGQIKVRPFILPPLLNDYPVRTGLKYIDVRARVGIAVDAGPVVLHYLLTDFGAVYVGLQH